MKCCVVVHNTILIQYVMIRSVIFCNFLLHTGYPKNFLGNFVGKNDTISRALLNSFLKLNKKYEKHRMI